MSGSDPPDPTRGVASERSLGGSDGHHLAAFLRARRELTCAADAGVETDPRRRIRWLRREEVARIAGVSREYYTRLEQGRDLHPSASVLTALARALELDTDAIAYMHELAGAPSTSARDGDPETPSPSLLALLKSWSAGPVFLQTRFHDTIACTPLGAALHPALHRDGNLLRLLFLDDGERAMTPDWEEVATTAVADLRAGAAAVPEDLRLVELVGELAVRSPEFTRMWGRQDVHVKRTGGKRLDHPVAGRLSLGYETFAVKSTPSQVLVVYTTIPGGREERALQELRSTLADPVTPFLPPRPGRH